MENRPSNAEPNAFMPEVAEAEHSENIRKQREWWAREKARESRAGMFTYLAVSSWMIRKAADSETDPNIRRARQELLLRRWRRLSSDVLRVPIPMPVL